MTTKVSDWQKIETAPTDGRKILVYSPTGAIEIAVWGNWRAGSYDYFSHWMPLPEAPKSS